MKLYSIIDSDSSFINTYQTIQCTVLTLGVERCVSVSLVLTSVPPTAAANPTPRNSKFVYRILIILRFLFDASIHTLLPYVVSNLLDLILLSKINPLPCALWFHSYAHVLIYWNDRHFIQVKNGLNRCVIKLDFFICRSIGSDHCWNLIWAPVTYRCLCYSVGGSVFWWAFAGSCWAVFCSWERFLWEIMHSNHFQYSCL